MRIDVFSRLEVVDRAAQILGPLSYQVSAGLRAHRETGASRLHHFFRGLSHGTEGNAALKRPHVNRIQNSPAAPYSKLQQLRPYVFTRLFKKNVDSREVNDRRKRRATFSGQEQVSHHPIV